MRTSTDRILTTHAGSLPRSGELTALQVASSRGEAIDEQALREAVLASTEAVVKGQAEAGIDIGNNGEQARESFFTYVRHRMSGFGGTSQRPVFQDMARYPAWLRLKIGDYTESVSLATAPQAQGEAPGGSGRPDPSGGGRHRRPAAGDCRHGLRVQHCRRFSRCGRGCGVG